MSLSGINVVEFAGLAPGPFAGLILADNGASVTRIDKPSFTASNDILCRGKRSIAVDPKTTSGRELLQKMVSLADIVIDPFRPGVMERLGLGPEVFLGDGKGQKLNSRLIYARIAGFSRTGHQKDMAGHDINYLASSGILAMLPGAGKPSFPLNILADFAGGGLICVTGILLALIERGKTGRGQVVNTDMVAGVQYLATFPLLHSLIPASPLFKSERGHNLLDGGAPYYDVYVCKDGRYMSIGCLEPQFFKAFMEVFLDALPKDFRLLDGWSPNARTQSDQDRWPQLRSFLERGFKTNTRDYWARVFHGTDACAVPVLSPQEAKSSTSTQTTFPLVHPEVLGSTFPVTSSRLNKWNLQPGEHTQEILEELKLGMAEKQRLVDEGALGEGPVLTRRSGHKL